MINTYKHLILVFLLLLIFTGCTEKHEVKPHGEFFAWMDAYLAVEKDIENTVAITLFYENSAPYTPNEIADISFIGIQDQVGIDDFRIETTETPDKKYSSFAITLNYIAKETGIFQTPGVIVTLKSNEAIQYPIGNWTFDVGELDAGKVNTWDAPVASSNGTQFPYQYSLENTEGFIKRIYYGDRRYIEDAQGIPTKGVIDLTGQYSAPIVYIKSKIVLSEGSKDLIGYGKGCYCGAVNFSEELLEKFKIHNATK